MGEISLSIGEMGRAHVAYYGEIARLRGDLHVLTIDDVGEVFGYENTSPLDFERLAASIRRKKTEADGKAFMADLSPIEADDFEIDFVRPDIVRIYVESSGGLKHLADGTAYYFDRTNPSSITASRYTSTGVKTKEFGLRKWGKVTAGDEKICFQNVCAWAANSADKEAAMFANIALSMGVFLSTQEGRYAEGTESADEKTMESLHSLTLYMGILSPPTSRMEEDSNATWNGERWE